MWNVRKEMLLYLEKNRYVTNIIIVANLFVLLFNFREIDSFCNILDKEVKLTEHCLLTNPKSYSSWYHRYWTLKLHPRADWAKELKLCMYYLNMDDRNCKFFRS